MPKNKLKVPQTLRTIYKYLIAEESQAIHEPDEDCKYSQFGEYLGAEVKRSKTRISVPYKGTTYIVPAIVIQPTEYLNEGDICNFIQTLGFVRLSDGVDINYKTKELLFEKTVKVWDELEEDGEDDEEIDDSVLGSGSLYEKHGHEIKEDRWKKILAILPACYATLYNSEMLEY